MLGPLCGESFHASMPIKICTRSLLVNDFRDWFSSRGFDFEVLQEHFISHPHRQSSIDEYALTGVQCLF